MSIKDKELYEWSDESFEDRVRKEMALPVWERPSSDRNFLYHIFFNPSDLHVLGMRLMI